MVSFAERMGGIKASDIRQLLAVASKPDIISFAGGLPAPELFPVEDIRKAYDAVLEEAGPTALQYGATDGWAPLRKQISERMLKKNNVTIDPAQIILTAGSQQGLDFIGKLFPATSSFWRARAILARSMPSGSISRSLSRFRRMKTA